MCMNAHGVPTKRRGFLSVLDVTLANSGAAGRVRQWKVGSEETLSDHRAIWYVVTTEDGLRARPPSQSIQRWNLRKADKDRIQTEAATIRAPPDTNAEDTTDWITKMTQDICKKSMLSAGRSDKKKVYWWHSEIAAARSLCQATRRRIQRQRKRHSDQTTIEGMEEELRGLRRDLRKKIKRAKGRAWNELIKTVDRDVWGMPYKIVRGKLGQSSDTPTSMEEAQAAYMQLFQTPQLWSTRTTNTTPRPYCP